MIVRPEGTAVRLALPGDAVAIGKVHAESWRIAYARQLPPEALSTAVALRLRLWTAEAVLDKTSGDAVLLVAQDAEGVCGFVHAVPGEVKGLYLHPRAWGTGAGSELLNAALASIDVQEVRIWTLAESGRARRFYEKSGFAWTGRLGDKELAPGVHRQTVEYLRRQASRTG